MTKSSKFIASLLVLLLAGASFGQDRTRRLSPTTPSSPHRIALVIGNDNYAGKRLLNAVNDARAVHAALQSLAFESILITDSSLRDMDGAVDRFVASIQPGDVALFYYSGHGIQIDGENYLIPTNYTANDEAEAKYQAYAAGRIHDRMLAASARLSIVILDACRNNPFRSAKSNSKGLAPMTAAKGSLIVFATAPGAEAQDAGPSETNGLFTGFLIDALREPGLAVEPLFSRVRQHVVESSQGKQVPWTGSSLIGEFIFNDPAARSRELRARIEKEEADLRQIQEQNRIAEAAIRSEEAKRADDRKQQELQTRIRLDQQEAERLKEASERQVELQLLSEALAKKNQEDERLRITEEERIATLHHEKAAALAELRTQSRTWKTLESARQEIAELNKRLADNRQKVTVQKDQELRQLTLDYQPIRELVPKPIKTEFETTGDFEKRKQQQLEQSAPIEKEFAAKKAAIEKRFGENLQTLIDEERRHRYEIDAFQDLRAPCKLQWSSYDADKEILSLLVDGSIDTIHLSRADAPLWKSNLKGLQCKVGFSGPNQPLNLRSIVGLDGIEHKRAEVSPPKAIQKVDPVYSAEARARRLEGKVVLSALIGEDGAITDIQVVTSLGSGLDEAAIDALKKWHLSPGKIDSEPITTRGTFEFNFKMR